MKMRRPQWVVALGGLALLPALALAQVAGDVDGNGTADQADLAMLESYLDGSSLLVEEQSRRADLNSDGQVDSRDVSALRRKLGLAAAPDEPVLSGRASSERAGERTAQNNRPTYRASAKGSTFSLGVAEVVPEWVRGNWRFRSQVYETQGPFAGGTVQEEQISLPGDLSGLYSTYKVGTNERLDRLCWQVNNYSDERFSFTEQLRDQAGAIYASTAEIFNRGFGQADIRIRVEILSPGRYGYGGGGDFFGGFFGLLFGGGRPVGGSLRTGDFYVRGGPMLRIAGTEKRRLPEANLEQLRCRQERY